ncbi:MAG: hypothetical protein K2X44_03125 [Magnetospirillum sp.]|nr:hypothetical protein [Magnetospirillum sp.]
MADVLNQIAAWATIGAFIAATISLAVIAFQANRYMSTRKADRHQREFENYHQLIRDLSQGGELVRIPAQKAIIYELRNYPRYADISIRVLTSLRDEWCADDKTRLVEELNLAIAYLEKAGK